ncbi:MAG: hypothetical protein IPQ15_13500 [Betaproteobacteria bacterium]|nr:hypothetical protein [Betaproteobacteria bacterium]
MNASVDAQNHQRMSELLVCQSMMRPPLRVVADPMRQRYSGAAHEH